MAGKVGGRGSKPSIGQAELDALDAKIRELRGELKLQEQKIKFLLDQQMEIPDFQATDLAN